MESQLFEGEIDRYEGITVDSQKEPSLITNFSSKLRESLKRWADDKRRCIWFKVDIKDSEWVPFLAKEGFNFHHSRDSFVMMFKWLPKDSRSNLPPACHTNLGVGAMVINDRNELLVVSEKHYDYPHWKLPGGYVERGEDIAAAAVREVKEETGINTTYQSLVTFRHTHNAMFGNSDIYVIVKLKADSDTINKSEIEINDCKWMNLDEYLNHPHVHEFNRFIVRQALDMEARNLRLNLRKNTTTIGKFTRDITSLILEDVSKL